MRWQSDNSLTLAAGCSSSGKTTFVCRYLLNGPFRTRFIFDPKGEFSARFSWPAAGAPDHLAAQLRFGWVVFDPFEMFEANTAQGLEFFAEWAWEVNQGRGVFVCDNVWQYISKGSPGRWLSNIAGDGRKRGLQSVFSTLDPSTLPDVIRNNWTEAVCFQLLGSEALYWARTSGFDPAEVSALARGHFVSRSSAGQIFRGKVPRIPGVTA